MAKETFAFFAARPAAAPAVLASGQNPDGTPWDLAATDEAVVLLGTISTLLALSAVADVVGTGAALVDISARESLLIASTRTPDTLAVEVGWGRAAGAADFYETVVVANNTSVAKPVGATHVHIRVRNTSGAAALTVHRTNIHAR